MATAGARKNLRMSGAPSTEQIAVFGGVYSNHLALRAVIDDLKKRGIHKAYCLGDLGAFGPHPDLVFPLFWESAIPVVQGNYDHSVGNGLADCQCGYTDALDNYFAKLSYDYTFKNTSVENKQWLKELCRRKSGCTSAGLTFFFAMDRPGKRTNFFGRHRLRMLSWRGFATNFMRISSSSHTPVCIGTAKSRTGNMWSTVARSVGPQMTAAQTSGMRF